MLTLRITYRPNKRIRAAEGCQPYCSPASRAPPPTHIVVESDPGRTQGASRHALGATISREPARLPELTRPVWRGFSRAGPWQTGLGQWNVNASATTRRMPLRPSTVPQPVACTAEWTATASSRERIAPELNGQPLRTSRIPMCPGLRRFHPGAAGAAGRISCRRRDRSQSQDRSQQPPS